VSAAPAPTLGADALLRLCVEQQELLPGDDEPELLSRSDLFLDRELCLDRGTPAGQVHELLVAEVLDDLDPGIEGNTVDAAVGELDVLRPETGDPVLSADAVDDLGRHQVHRGRADEPGDEQGSRLAVELL